MWDGEDFPRGDHRPAALYPSHENAQQSEIWKFRIIHLTLFLLILFMIEFMYCKM